MSNSRQQKRKADANPEEPDGKSARRRRRRRLNVTPAVYLPAGRFQPPHCSNRDCPFYQPSPEWHYQFWGYYHPRASREPLHRYQCLHCRRTFTARSFSATYWLHRFELFTAIAAASIAGSGLRQTARNLGVAHSTVQRHLSRAARHCFVYHGDLIRGAPLHEPVAIDGFETFEFSQFFPFHLNLASGHESWFIYHFTDSPLRRKGTMTAEQKVRRTALEKELGRPDPKAVERGILELVRTLRELKRQSGSACAVWGAPAIGPEPARPGQAVGKPAALEPLVLHSDEHPAYKRALRQVREDNHPRPVIHRVTPSTDPRTRANPLFPINLADLLLRHCGANHRRETIAFSKRRQGAIERLAVFTVWRNAIKNRQENKPGQTAAMQIGVLDRPLTWGRLFSRRRFPREIELPGSWWSYYWRRIRTLALGDAQTELKCRFAF